MTSDNVVKLKQVHGGYVIADGPLAEPLFQSDVGQGKIKREGPEKEMTYQEVPVAAVEPPLPLGEKQNCKDATPEKEPTMTHLEVSSLLHSFFQWVVRGPLLEQLVQMNNLQGARTRRAEDCVNCFLAANGIKRSFVPPTLEYIWPSWGPPGQAEAGRPKTTAERDLELLCRTLLGKENLQQLPLAEMGVHVVATLIRKNSDYGASVFQPSMLVPNVNPEEAMLVRVGDKLQRVKKLRENKNKSLVQSESLGDTYLDLAGYFILLATWLMCFTATEENDAFEKECSL